MRVPTNPRLPPQRQAREAIDGEMEREVPLRDGRTLLRLRLTKPGRAPRLGIMSGHVAVARKAVAAVQYAESGASRGEGPWLAGAEGQPGELRASGAAARHRWPARYRPGPAGWSAPDALPARVAVGALVGERRPAMLRVVAGRPAGTSG
ncbi:unnamed protein product [Diplocarpon coronariae]|nr:hypothetical protein JHW43_006725 [Diplocarpon mali]